ncbi:MAG: FixH family protein [Ferruginibacter sp.]
MNWGYRILIVYLVFVAGIVFLVVKSSSQNQDLVTTDYYEQELKFQDKIDEVHRANALSSSIQYEIKKDELLIILPIEMKDKPVKADVMLYCTANENNDVKNSYNTNSGQIHFPLIANNKGLHELKIAWSANGISYYYEHKLMLP